MTSQARIIANRRNAKLSTGPRTVEGKARASKNALRHGLTAAAPKVEGAPVEVLGLAGPLRSQGEASVAARIAAEAELQLIRIRTIKRRTLEAAMRSAEARGKQDQSFNSDEVMARALLDCADELTKLDGYERKARSRRKKAFRAL